MSENESKEKMVNEKNQLLKFAQIIEQLKSQSNGIQISIEDQSFLEQVRDTYMDNPEYFELLKNIMDAPLGGCISVLEEFYKKKEEEEKKDKNPEEEISKVFGVSPNQIQHLFLKNGKEVFFFYSFELEKDILLENSNKGKSLMEVLEEIQNNDEKYQMDSDEENTNHIMMDERLKNNLELEMVPVEEVLGHTSEIDQLNDDDKKLLNHLVSHKDELDIKEINIENLVYITNDHKLKEITFDKDFKPVVSSPESENIEDSNDPVQNDTVIEDASVAAIATVAAAPMIQQSIASFNNLDSMSNNNNSFGGKEENHSSNEMNSMMEEAYQKEDEKEKEKELEKQDVKKLILVKKDEHGFVGYVELLVLISALFTLLFLSLKLFSIL